ncbi:MAG: hypothetical protein QXY94_00305 [Archaeoglobaceae archaeon]
MNQKVEKAIDILRSNLEVFAQTCLYISTKDGSLVPFRFNRAQKRLYGLLRQDMKEGPIRWTILKARQIGLSTFIAAFIYWRISLNRHRRALVVSHNMDSASYLFNIHKLFYKMSPPEVRPLRKISNRRELYFANPDELGPMGLESSISVSTAENPEIGRSYTLHDVHLSEIAAWEELGYDPRVRLSSLHQAVPPVRGTSIFLETTGRGPGFFYDKWFDETDGYRKIFVSWIADPTYRIDTDSLELDLSEDVQSEWGDEVEEYDLIKRELEFWQPELSPQDIQREIMCRLLWRRKMISTQCHHDLRVFRQEYPTTPEQAFQAYGANVFDGAAISELIQEAKRAPAPERFRFCREFRSNWRDLSSAFAPSPTGKLLLYEKPQEGFRYVIGADVAEGLEYGDFSAAIVLRLPELVEVASFCDRISPHDFAFVLYALGKAYRNALIGVEANESGGYATLHKLAHELHYHHLYRRDLFLHAQTGMKEQKLGWVTSKITKPIMIADMASLLFDREIHLRTVECLEQLRRYKKFEDGSLGCPAPYHDDLAVAAMIAVQMSKQIRVYPASSSPSRKKYTLDWWASLLDSPRSWL